VDLLLGHFVLHGIPGSGLKPMQPSVNGELNQLLVTWSLPLRLSQGGVSAIPECFVAAVVVVQVLALLQQLSAQGAEVGSIH
jgi:hypothetical protein